MTAAKKNLIESFLDWLRLCRHRRHWTAKTQLEHLRTMVSEDHRWLAHDKTAAALTTRYLAALRPDWMSVTHASASRFRRDADLEPDAKRTDRP